jgi:hypothetical protein
VRAVVSALWLEIRTAPDPVTGAVVGGAVLGILGGVVGLVLGVSAYPPTAWAAVFEVGAPAAVLGAATGAVVGLVRSLLRHD